MRILTYHETILLIPWETNNSYGELIIKLTKDKIEIYNENLTKDEIKTILNKFVENILNNGILQEFRRD